MTSHDNVTDIVERLVRLETRENSHGLANEYVVNPDGLEAARYIATLRERADALALQADEWEGKYQIVSDMNATLRKQLENAREALRQCRNAVKGGKDEPRRNVREIVDEALGQKTTLGGELANQYIEDQQP